MKHFFLLWVLLNLLFVACNDDKDEEQALETFPESLQLAITDLQSSDNMCDICTVEIIEFNGKNYYHLYCQIWSCVYCNVYDVNGNDVSFEQEEWESFLQDHKVIRTVPMCQD